MALSNRKVRDPLNEALRKDSEGCPDLEPEITELLYKTSRVHAAFLFHDFGLETLQQLCLCLSSTNNSYNFSGWEEFGIHLGLNPLVIKCIHHNFNSQDPTYYILLTYVQREDATLNKIVTALKRMERFDVITTIISFMSGLADNVLASNMNNEDSGCFSISDNGSDSLSDAGYSCRSIIRPLSIPPAPFVCRNINRNYARIESPSIEEDSHQTAVPVRRNKPINKYGRKVLLTFASDGLDTAYQVAAVFRREREGLPRIGVVILNEQADRVNSNPDIGSFFRQVDYVVPIITENYLKAVSSKNPEPESSLMCMDTKYIQFIYNMMSTYYLRNGCINDKIRCVVPDSLVHLTQRHPRMSEPLFQVWVRASETEQLSLRILRSRF